GRRVAPAFVRRQPMTTSGELTLVAKYTSFVTTTQEILDTANRHQWAPATAEFIDMVRQGGSDNVREIGDVMALLGALQLRQTGGRKGQPLSKGSLKRVNLFAHGDNSGISLNGRVVQPKVDRRLPQIAEHAIVTMASG